MRVAIAPSNVVSAGDVGGHFWVFMQYAQALLSMGIDVVWVERLRSWGDARRDRADLTRFARNLEHFDLRPTLALYTEEEVDGERRRRFINIEQTAAERLLAGCELLLNFDYRIDPDLLGCFPCTALVDIDPGLLQFWVSHGQIDLPAHSVYLTTGETVGAPGSLFSDLGLSWIRIRPPVCLDLWPYSFTPGAPSFTTVSSWWGGDGAGEWITDGRALHYENNKRVSFLEFAHLPSLTDQNLELALYLGEGDDRLDRPVAGFSDWQGVQPLREEVTDYEDDATDRLRLERCGWRIVHSRDVAGTPMAYRRYVQLSRGEFSCVKPSCIRLDNAWISDRTVCYLASGKPAVVQHTGESAYLAHGEGLFRVRTAEEAAEALGAVNADYEKHCRAAREIAECFFDARPILESVIDATTCRPRVTTTRPVAASLVPTQQRGHVDG